MGIASLVILIAVRATQSELVPTVDEAFSLVADAEPAFAGAYVDGDELVVTMTDQGDPGRALGEMRRLFGGRLNRLRPRVAAAQHAWNSLLSYRHVVKDLFAMEEVLKLDIDEKDNRVVVGVSSLRRVPDMEAYLFAMGVPGSAVTFRLTGPDVPVAALTDLFRPVIGGIQISLTPSQVLCTLSFNAIDANGSTRAVTNAHCTSNIGIIDNETAWQPLSASNNAIGKEVFDPAYRTDLNGCASTLQCTACAPGFACRWSDSTLLTGNVVTGSYNKLGSVARPTGIGSLVVDAARPEFRIMGEIPQPMVGDSLHRVGRTSGWQSGTVTSTCADSRLEGTSIMYLCQSYMTTPAIPGDSGSPVFSFPDPAVYSNDVLLRGIVWGHNPAETVFSPIENVEKDLGPLNTCPAAYNTACSTPGFGSGACVNLLTDRNNCGSCGHVCATGASCSNGACVVPAPEPQCPSSRPYDCCGDASICGTSWAMCARVNCPL